MVVEGTIAVSTRSRSVVVVSRFVTDTAVELVAPGRYRVQIDEGWWIQRGPNGGYLAAIVLRLIWVPLAVVIPRLVSRALRARDPIPPWPQVLLVSWIGMRGIVSLAAALALPETTASGAPFPFRDEIILVTFAVILATLVLQGLSLTPLIRFLELGEDRADGLPEALVPGGLVEADRAADHAKRAAP